jgi:hypothetical protein
VDVAEHVQTILQNWRRILVVSLVLAFVVLVYDMRKPKE